jgi:uncharacterized protein with HEPN domain
MTKDPRVYLARILECVQKIERFTADGKGRFMRDRMVQDAVMRNFSIIGEAARRLDGSYVAAHPEIPWRALAGLRDVLIHQHEGVDPERVWAIVERELPNLREAIAALLPPLDQLERELAGEEDPPEQDR